MLAGNGNVILDHNYLLEIRIHKKIQIYCHNSWHVALNYAAYFAEIYRSGIESMPVGQYEAARLLGYNKAQTFFKIILPQVIKRILPSITNEVIMSCKGYFTCILNCLILEMFTVAKQIASSNTSVYTVLLLQVCSILFLTSVVAWCNGTLLEKKLNYYQIGGGNMKRFRNE